MGHRDVIIDCDTGVDDALALLLALRTPTLNVLGITTVAGNVIVEKVVRNTLITVEHARRQVPVFAGAPAPLKGSWRTAEAIHGLDGLGDLGFPDPKITAHCEPAVDFLVRTLMHSPGTIDLITLGPLTNIALALLREPRLEKSVRSLLMMAGGITKGNITPLAEFNVWVDPEAADIVFRSRIPKTMVAIDPILKGGGIEVEDVRRIAHMDTPWCSMAGKLLRVQQAQWGTQGGRQRPAKPHDLAAMGVAIAPSIAPSMMRYVAVETWREHTYGRTLVGQRDKLANGSEPNVNVVTHIDNLRYRDLVVRTLLAPDDARD